MSAETLSSSSGSIYVAEIQAMLPPVEAVKTNYLNHYARFTLAQTTGINDADYYHHDNAYFITGQFFTTEGEAIYPVSDFKIAHIDEQHDYVLLQDSLDEESENFTAQFCRRADSEDFDYVIGGQRVTADNSVFYVAPMAACGSEQPVPAAAILAVDSEATSIFNGPSQKQIEAYILAAALALNDTAFSHIS